ncbi:hypothetical protein K3725_00775 [Leisingera sp. S132]|uniref:hypothetical protein n=1 Tax=Leisingera sp. S132 TaxID=2867016 RepID=UPI0021A4EFDC|nr:hypothetical protein [Leisingera sp. S132]UWQ79575.1 hypothetical protein K3725_00775 [Leisingera sp. S132]
MSILLTGLAVPFASHMVASSDAASLGQLQAKALSPVARADAASFQQPDGNKTARLRLTKV